jgi:hypothetical protein
MRQNDRSRSESGDECLEVLSVRVEQTLASLGEAEIYLRNLNMGRLPKAAESLAAAAASARSLRETLSASSQGCRIPTLLRAEMKRLEHAARRVSALHQAARSFHAGLLLVRKRELAEYDASGGVSEMPASLIPAHSLEARG